MTDRLFSIDDVPSVPLFREPRRRGAARGVSLDARFANDYPAEWDRCPRCEGTGSTWSEEFYKFGEPAPRAIEKGERVLFVWEGPDLTAVRAGLSDMEPGDVGTLVGYRLGGHRCMACLGMGSHKAMVRLLAGHRCERCRHPYVPKGDAERLGVEMSGLHPGPDGGKVWTPWSACDAECTHGGPVRVQGTEGGEWLDIVRLLKVGPMIAESGQPYEAEWRILTVHHLDGDKANLAWWNLAALCQRCHLEIQAKVVMERVYPFEHSEWFKPHAAGWYAHVYLGAELTREQTIARMDELLLLERSV